MGKKVILLQRNGLNIKKVNKPPRVRKGAKGIFVVNCKIPAIRPITENTSPISEARPIATNKPGNPVKTPIKAANFISPIPSFPCVNKYTNKKIRGPVIIFRATTDKRSSKK